MAAPFSLLREGEDKAWVVDGAGEPVVAARIVAGASPALVVTEAAVS